MKKILAVTIAIVLMLSLSATAFAGLGATPGAAQYSPELFAQNIAKSRANAGEGIVLMENDGILPLKPGTGVALFGMCAKNTIKGGGGSGDVYTDDSDLIKIWQGLQMVGLELDPQVLAWYQSQGTGSVDVAIQAGLVESAATRNDTAVYVIGRTSSEGSDRTGTGNTSYFLTAIEIANMARIFNEFDNVIVILSCGAVCDTNWMEEFPANALVFGGLGGHAGGAAVGDVLVGNVNPSGKFVDTWCYDLWDNPAHYNFSNVINTRVGPLGQAGYANSPGFYSSAMNNSTVSMDLGWVNYATMVYTEDIYVGYRYFETFDIPVKYEFGYGLSYTTFALTNRSAKVVGDELVASVTVTNTGNVAGKEVVQVYMSAPDGLLEKPAKELKGYAKTDLLNPGQSQTIEIKTPLYWLSSYSEDLEAWILDAGLYNFFIGTSVKQVALAGSWNLANMRITLQSKNSAQPLNGRDKVVYPTLSKFDDKEAQDAKRARFVLPAVVNPATVRVNGTDEVVRGRFPGDHWFYTASDLVEIDGVLYTPADWGVNWVNPNPVWARDQEDFRVRKLLDTRTYTLLDVYNGTVTMQRFLSQLSPYDLGCLQRGGGGDTGITQILPGSAAHNNGIAFFGIPQTSHPDGPAGLRITLSVGTGSNQVTQKATMFPQGTINAQTWNTDLIFNAGLAVGDEMVHYGASFWLAPGMNIHRDPMNGRNFEYYSEDPFMSGTVAAAMTRGVQASGGVSVTLKHYFANNQEWQRTSHDTLMTERCAREIYLRHFEIAVREGNPRAMMTVYNHFNGEHINQRADLLTDLTRGEWGFEGIFMYDWGAYGDGWLKAEAGVNLIMGSAGGGRLLRLEDLCYYNRPVAEQRVAEYLVEVMHQRSFTEPNNLPTWYSTPGPNTQSVEKSAIDTYQTAGITAPKNYVGTGDLVYTISLSNINIGANMVSISAQFGTALDYVDSVIAIPGWSVYSAEFNEATGFYTAVIQLLEQGALSKIPDVAPVLKVIFSGAADSDQLGVLSNAVVWEVTAPTNSINVVCKLSPAEALALYAPYDADGDGAVTLNDISLIIYNFYGAIAGDSKWAAASAYDVNDDGVVDIFDLMIIMTYI